MIGAATLIALLGMYLIALATYLKIQRMKERP